jgi:hypothetical protein
MTKTTAILPIAAIVKLRFAGVVDPVASDAPRQNVTTISR